MERILTVFAGDDIIGDTHYAGALRKTVEDVLGEGDDLVVVLDFDGVNGLSHDFVDELLAPLFDALGDALPDRVLLDRCSASVLNDLKCVAEMHRPVTLDGVSPRRGRQAA